MPISPLARLAGPAALAAGVLMVGAQLVMLPFDPHDHVATSTDPVFQIGGVFYFLGFGALLLALVASSLRQQHRAGRFGVVATVTALLGTFFLGGDLWFETFAVPWIADQGPATLDTDPTVMLAIGAISSYVLFADRLVALRHRELPGARLPPQHRHRHRRRGRDRLQRAAGAVRDPARPRRRCPRHLAAPPPGDRSGRGGRAPIPALVRG